MRLIKYAVLAVLAIALMIVALANTDPMTLKLLPKGLADAVGRQWQVTLPIYGVLFIAVLVGLALGYVGEWLREHKHRADAAAERRERQRLEQEVKRVAPPSKPGDDVLAILDGR